MKSSKFTLLALVFLFGCGGGSRLPDGATGTVSGKLTLNGQVAPAGASVVMIHKDKGLAASGTAAADGSYSLKMRGEDAVLAGTYYVGVSPPPAPEISAEEYDKAMATGQALPEPDHSAFPKKYLDPRTSEILFDVKEGPNTFDLDMKSE